jgi:hypothetical protein
VQTANKVLAAPKRVTKGSDYIDKTVIHPNQEALGEIVDLATDGAQGRVIYVVLGSGGLFRIGQDLHAVPLSVFSKTSKEDDLALDI